MATVLIADMLVWLLRYSATSESLDAITQSASIVLTVSIGVSVASIFVVPGPSAFAIARISLMTAALLVCQPSDRTIERDGWHIGVGLADGRERVWLE